MSRHRYLGPAGAVTATVVVAALVPALVAAPGEASRAVNQTYAVPSNGVLQLTGHGFGHGHGMSQYGAQGAARQGLTHQQILAFYYPGTTLGTTTGSMRVKLSGATTKSLVVQNASGLEVRSAGSSTSYPATATGATQWRLRTSGSSTLLDYYDGTWHNAVRTLAGAAELYGPATLNLRLSGAWRPYRGAARLTSEGYTVDVLGVDDYVRGVVAREMPASWLANALQSQAVAARTYGVYDRSAHPSRSYDTCDTTSCQVYGGVAGEDSRSNAAVTATAGQVLTYGGQPAFTQFGSSDGGWTSAGSEPYLPAKADPYDGFSGNPVHTWTKTITRAAIQKAWPSLGTLTRTVVTQRDGNGDWYGRVEKLVLDGSKNNVTVTGDTFRSRFGLRSSWFSFSGATTSTTQSSVSAITRRWRAIGGNHSIVGRPRGAEYSVSGGRARKFAHGRIFWSQTTGAHEVYKKVLKAYLRRGGAAGRLGFPLTSPHKVGRAVRATFQHGTITAPRKGKVRVTWR
jgi:stage II sporulation protein D